ncbi:MAG: hypothetical protein JNK67_29010 [Alphaproteobacteria bacterium]|nr:hypothetical protein [Alphaproteobacteria bacterium]
MTGLARALILAAALAAGTAAAAPVEPALQAELLKVYEAFNAAVKKGDYKAAMATRDQETRKSIEQQVKTEKQRKDFIDQNRMMLPTKVDVQDGWRSDSGTEAELEVTATLLAPKHVRGKNGVPKDGIVQQPISLEFKREGGTWKYAMPTFRMAPSQVVKCDENQAEAEKAFDDQTNLSVGGLIKRVKFAADYTAIVIDVVGEENCLYLPDKAFLQKAGLNTDLLEPRALVEGEGYRHRSDKQKAWLTGLKVTRR